MTVKELIAHLDALPQDWEVEMLDGVFKIDTVVSIESEKKVFLE